MIKHTEINTIVIRKIVCTSHSSRHISDMNGHYLRLLHGVSVLRFRKLSGHADNKCSISLGIKDNERAIKRQPSGLGG